jgi:hypothetical protein
MTTRTVLSTHSAMHIGIARAVIHGTPSDGMRDPDNPGVQFGAPDIATVREWLAEHGPALTRAGVNDVDELLRLADEQIAARAAEEAERERERAAQRAAEIAAARAELPGAVARTVIAAAAMHAALHKLDELWAPFVEMIERRAELHAAGSDLAAVMRRIDPKMGGIDWREPSDDLRDATADVAGYDTARQWLPDGRPTPIPVRSPGIINTLFHAETGGFLPLAQRQETHDEPGA